MDYKFFLRQIWISVISPSKVLAEIPGQSHSIRHIRNNLFFPLLVIVAICSFLGSVFFANVTLQPVYSIFLSLKFVILDLILVYLSALVFREIAKALDLQADYSWSFKILVYTMIPFFLCQVVSLLFESLAFVNILSLYGLRTIWLTGESLLNTPAHKRVPMLVANFIVITELYIGGAIALTSVIDRIYFHFFA
ncbi:MAG TPA: hypothetical protein VMT63_02410 [Bacteroidales bacterium]|nr:hypothetical protein [Bacteroidales bacterium]